MSDYDALTRKLFGRTGRGIELGLDRMRAAAGALGDPQMSTRSIHVAGTNGKGSVCAFVESMLRECGCTTGLFTKPHLVRLEERFLLDGRPVETGEMLAAYAGIDDLVDRLDLTFFEATTLLAFELFRRRRVDWAVYETGLGGRLDSTNVVAPRVTVITRIALDHTQYLGDTPEAIAAEKLGIVKAGVPLIMAEPEQPGIRRLAEETCAARGAPLVTARMAELEDLRAIPGGTEFSRRGGRYRAPLPGPYQPLNALCALKAFEAIEAGGPDCARRGLAKTRLPARFQILSSGAAECVLDVGHNPDAVAAHVGALRVCLPGKPVWFVVGIMADKDYRAMLRTLCGYDKTVGLVLTRPAAERAASTDALRAAVPGSFTGKTLAIEPVAEAVRVALAKGTGVVSIVGSFFTVGEAMTMLGVEPYGGGLDAARKPASG